MGHISSDTGEYIPTDQEQADMDLAEDELTFIANAKEQMLWTVLDMAAHCVLPQKDTQDGIERITEAFEDMFGDVWEKSLIKSRSLTWSRTVGEKYQK